MCVHACVHMCASEWGCWVTSFFSFLFTSVHLHLNIHSYQRFPTSSYSCIPDVLLLVYKRPPKGHILHNITHLFVSCGCFCTTPPVSPPFFNQPLFSPSPNRYLAPPHHRCEKGHLKLAHQFVCLYTMQCLFFHTLFFPVIWQDKEIMLWNGDLSQTIIWYSQIVQERIRRLCFEMGICHKPLYGILK